MKRNLQITNITLNTADRPLDHLRGLIPVTN